MTDDAPDEATNKWFADLQQIAANDDSQLDSHELRTMLARMPHAIRPAAQAAAVRRAAMNLRGHVNNLIDLLAQRKRSKAEVYQQLQWLPALLAAAESLKKFDTEPS
jgi:hypothetical protein